LLLFLRWCWQTRLAVAVVVAGSSWIKAGGQRSSLFLLLLLLNVDHCIDEPLQVLEGRLLRYSSSSTKKNCRRKYYRHLVRRNAYLAFCWLGVLTGGGGGGGGATPGRGSRLRFCLLIVVNANNKNAVRRLLLVFSFKFAAWTLLRGTTT
jgi:hypothetical protein